MLTKTSIFFNFLTMFLKKNYKYSWLNLMKNTKLEYGDLVL